MTKQEFTEKTGFYPSEGQFFNILQDYTESKEDKDTWCKEWVRNGGIKVLSKEIATWFDSVVKSESGFKTLFCEYQKMVEFWRENCEEKNREIEALKNEVKKWKDVVEAIRMSIPKE